MADVELSVAMIDKLTGPSDKVSGALGKLRSQALSAAGGLQSARDALNKATAAGKVSASLKLRAAAAEQRYADVVARIKNLPAEQAAIAERAAAKAASAQAKQAAAADRAAARAAAAADRAAARAAAAADRAAARSAAAAAKTKAAVEKAAAAAMKQSKATGFAARKWTDWRTSAVFAAKKAIVAQKGASAVQEGMTDALSNMLPIAGGVAGAVSALVSKVLALAAAAVKAAIALAVRFGRAVIDTASFLDRNAKAMANLTGSMAKGSRAMDRAQGIALKFKLPLEETVDAYRALLAAQFTPRDTERILMMTSAMRAFGGTADEASRIIAQLKQVKALGKAGGEELRVMAEAGLSLELVFKAMASQTGKSVADIRKMVQAGQVTSEMLLDAVEGAILLKTHTKALGEAAAAGGLTMEAAFTDINNALDGVKIAIARELLPVLGPAFAEIATAIKNAFAGPDAQGALRGLVNGLKTIIGWLPAIARAAIAVAGFFARHWKVIAVVVGTVSAAVGLATAAVLAFVGAGAAALGAVVVAIGFVVEAAIDLARFFKGLPSKILGALSTIGSAVAGAASAAASAALGIGVSIVTGIVSGIRSGAGQVANALASLVGGAKQFTQGQLKASSPSKVFANLGMDTAAGFGEGIGAGAPLVRAGAAGMVRAAVGGAAGAGGAGPRVGSFTLNATIQVSGAGDAEATAQAVRRVLVEEMGLAFELVAEQMGAT